MFTESDRTTFVRERGGVGRRGGLRPLRGGRKEGLRCIYFAHAEVTRGRGKGENGSGPSERGVL